MTPAGLAAYQARKPDKTGIYAFEQRRSARLGKEQEEEFRAHPGGVGVLPGATALLPADRAPLGRQCEAGGDARPTARDADRGFLGGPAARSADATPLSESEAEVSDLRWRLGANSRRCLPLSFRSDYAAAGTSAIERRSASASGVRE
jgi:hypothetical protein